MIELMWVGYHPECVDGGDHEQDPFTYTCRRGCGAVNIWHHAERIAASKIGEKIGDRR